MCNLQLGITEVLCFISDLLKTLKEKGCINKMSSEEHKLLINTPLQCNQCTFKPKNMPQLKEHLLSHIK